MPDEPTPNEQKHPLELTVVVPTYSAGGFERFFACCYPLVEVVEELSRNAVNVTVVSRYSTNGEIHRNGIRYLFVADSLGEQPRSWQVSLSLLKAVQQLSGDIVHLHSLSYFNLAAAIKQLQNSSARVVGEYHSDQQKSGVMGYLQRKALSCLDLLLFSNTADADKWTDWLAPNCPRTGLSIEASSRFCYAPRHSARVTTGFAGEPVFLWNSRLISRRHPLCVLAGFRQALEKLSGARLYMMIPDWEPSLLHKLMSEVHRDPALERAVTLMPGRRPHSEMETFYNSADYLLSASEGDAYGFGAADAMSCGVIPIVPDLATFRDITDQGSIGGLWELGNTASLADAIITVVARTYGSIDSEARRAAQSFATRLSYPVIAKELLGQYHSCLKE